MKKDTLLVRLGAIIIILVMIVLALQLSQVSKNEKNQVIGVPSKINTEYLSGGTATGVSTTEDIHDEVVSTSADTENVNDNLFE